MKRCQAGITNHVRPPHGSWSRNFDCESRVLVRVSSINKQTKVAADGPASPRPARVSRFPLHCIDNGFWMAPTSPTFEFCSCEAVQVQIVSAVTLTKPLTQLRKSLRSYRLGGWSYTSSDLLRPWVLPGFVSQCKGQGPPLSLPRTLPETDASRNLLKK